MTRVSSRALALALCLIFARAAAKGEADLQEQLVTRYANKILTLRHSLTAGTQRYGFDGTPLVSGAAGPWTVYGRIAVDKIKIQPDELRVEGRRVIFKFDEKTKELMPFTDRDRVSMIIQLKQPLGSEGEANAALVHVFAVTRQDVVDSVPDYWRRYVTIHTPGNLGPEAEANAQSKEDAASQLTIGGEKVHRLGDAGLIAPKPKFTPDPEFSDAARRGQIQGTLALSVVVDATGRVVAVQIVKPLGAGLDDNAAHTVVTWRFSPATLGGRAVPVVFDVEVDFHLGQ